MASGQRLTAADAQRISDMNTGGGRGVDRVEKKQTIEACCMHLKSRMTSIAVTACKECHMEHIHLERAKKGDLQELWHDTAESFVLGLPVLFCTDSLGHSWQQQAHQIFLMYEDEKKHGHSVRGPAHQLLLILKALRA
ncbi:MAG: hypothetical protein FRX49_09511 [Trebouxia sp. A1-2]|nr:MAG: hypothetical protein FRX49_09511 [Trebouxia sp. A1-2]